MAQETDVKRPAAYEKHIRALVQYFRMVVFAGEYDIEVQFVTELGGKYADVIVSPKYLTVRLRFTDDVLGWWQKGLWRKLADVVCHEMSHILTEPMWRLAEPHFSKVTDDTLTEVNERQTQRICNTILHLAPTTAWKPKKGANSV